MRGRSCLLLSLSELSMKRSGDRKDFCFRSSLRGTPQPGTGFLALTAMTTLIEAIATAATVAPESKVLVD